MGVEPGSAWADEPPRADPRRYVHARLIRPRNDEREEPIAGWSMRARETGLSFCVKTDRANDNRSGAGWLSGRCRLRIEVTAHQVSTAQAPTRGPYDVAQRASLSETA